MENELIKTRVLAIYQQFVSEVDPDRLSDYLKQDLIIEIEEYQTIHSRNPDQIGRCRALLDHLLSNGNPRTFVVVRNALYYVAPHLLQHIDQPLKPLATQTASEPTIKYTKQPKLVKRIDAASSVWGLALLNNELFVSSVCETFLVVFNPSTLEQLRQVFIVGFGTPRDIESCQLNNCIYLVCESSNSLACIDRQGAIIRQWELQDRPHNISVAESGNIIVTCNARILEYSSGGTLLRNIKLDEKELNMTWHAILLDSGNFIVCQGWGGSEYHYTLMLDPQGKILRSCGSGRGQHDCHMREPVYLARDKDGYIFVADSGSNSVILLDKDLNFIRKYLTDGQDVIQPYRIVFDEPSRRLYVGTSSGKLFMFKVY